MQHLSSRMLKPSLTESFVDAWTSSLEDSRVSHSVLLESVKLLKTPDISSPTSQTESESANLELFSLKTYKESSPARQPTENPFSNMSSESWKEWVIEQRQEYSQRKKSAHLIRESESSSWATPVAMNDGIYADNSPNKNNRHGEGLATQAQNWPTMTVKSGGGLPPNSQSKSKSRKQHAGHPLETAVMREPQNWPTATARDWKGCGNAITRKDGKHRIDNLEAVIKYGHPDRVNPNTNGKSQESWPTPRANKVHPEITEQNREHLANRKKANLEEDIAGHCGKATGKLNPNWVEHLMGLPAGWTDLGSWETE
jgi:hypothetical protein